MNKNGFDFVDAGVDIVAGPPKLNSFCGKLAGFGCSACFGGSVFCGLKLNLGGSDLTGAGSSSGGVGCTTGGVGVGLPNEIGSTVGGGAVVTGATGVWTTTGAGDGVAATESCRASGCCGGGACLTCCGACGIGALIICAMPAGWGMICGELDISGGCC